MAKIPKELNVTQHENDYTIVVNHFDGNIMSFQIICVALPLFCWLLYTIVHFTSFFFIPLFLMAVTILWIVRSAKDKTTMHITNEQFEIREGWMQTVKFCFDLNSISKVRIHTVNGKVLTSARTASTTKTKPIYELILTTSEGDVVATRDIGYSSEVYIKGILDSKITGL